MSTPGDRSRTSSKTWMLLVGLIVAGAAFFAVTYWPSQGQTREQQAEARAAALREQSIKESPTPVTPEVVVDPNVPPTRGPMGSPPKR